MFQVKSTLSYLVTLSLMHLNSQIHWTFWTIHTKNINYQKIKDIVLKDIKKDICDLIQNKIRQKINIYSQDEHQTLVDKKMIANLEEIHFLKT